MPWPSEAGSGCGLGRDELHGGTTQEREGAKDPTEHGEGMTRKVKDFLKIYLEKIEE